MTNNHGFIRVAAAIPNVKISDCRYNTERIKNLIQQADKEKVEIICFPELCITAYTCADLFYQKQLLVSAEESLSQLLQETKDLEITFIVGALCPGLEAQFPARRREERGRADLSRF